MPRGLRPRAFHLGTLRDHLRRGVPGPLGCGQSGGEFATRPAGWRTRCPAVSPCPPRDCVACGGRVRHFATPTAVRSRPLPAPRPQRTPCLPTCHGVSEPALRLPLSAASGTGSEFPSPAGRVEAVAECVCVRRDTPVLIMSRPGCAPRRAVTGLLAPSPAKAGAPNGARLSASRRRETPGG